MILGCVGVLVGCLLAAAGRGRISHLRRHDLRWLAPMTAAASLVLASHLGVIGSAGALAAGALAVLAIGCLANLHIAGAGVVAVGLALNVVPLVLVGATPVDARALDAVGSTPEQLGPTQVLVGSSTPLPILASRIPVPPTGTVVSFGDLIVMVGLAATSRSLLLAPRRRGIPVREILDDGPLTIEPVEPLIDLTRPPHRERAVEVGPGQPVPVPVGWERDDDGVTPPADASLRPRRSRAHPTMRLANR